MVFLWVGFELASAYGVTTNNISDLFPIRLAANLQVDLEECATNPRMSLGVPVQVRVGRSDAGQA
jgi:hypothetical protein